MIHLFKRKKLDADMALRKMAKIAGYKYEDCIRKTDDGDGWNYDLEWTEKKSLKFKRWLIKRLPRYMTDRKKLYEYSMFDLHYGFRIKD